MKKTLLISIILLLFVSWNSAFAQNVNLVNVKVYDDVNSNFQMEKGENLITQDMNFYLLIEKSPPVNNICDRDDAGSKVLQVITETDSVFINIPLNTCVWVTVFDANYVPGLSQDLLFNDKELKERRSYVLAGQYTKTYLPIVGKD